MNGRKGKGRPLRAGGLLLCLVNRQDDQKNSLNWGNRSLPLSKSRLL